MNRKKFIGSIAIISVGSLASYYGFKFFKSIGTPDINYLEKNKALIADLCEAIIPKTDSPGAKMAMVHEYIIYAISQSRDIKHKNNFINGLKDLQDYSLSKFNLEFSKLNKSQQSEILKHFQNKAKSYNAKVEKIQNKILGKPFFTILRETTTIGYCTSVIGAQQGLAYDYVPTKFIACSDYVKGQKSWATK